MVIPAGDKEGAGRRSSSRRSSAKGERQQLTRASSSTSPPPPPTLREAKEVFNSRRLHNFSFPTTSLSWRNQRLLRCSNSPDPTDPGSNQPPPSAVATGHNNHHTAASGKRPASLYSSPSRDKSRAEDSPSSLPAAGVTVEAATEAAAAARPWNLRTRRAACNAPEENGSNRSQVLVSGSPSRLANENNGGPVGKTGRMPSAGLEKRKQLELSIMLTKEEIEEDYLAFKGAKPPRRPKRRPRTVQRHIELLFPGFGLLEISPDAYKIVE